jgi:transposase
MNPITVGLDIAKNVFQLHGVDASGEVVVQRRLRRGQVEGFFARLPTATIGIEACGSAHHWGRVLRSQGHDVRLMPPAYVKPYLRRNKTDGRDAEAICEAVGRPTMRFVAIKSIDAQAVNALHKARQLLVRQRSMLANAFRALLAEFGIVARQGTNGLAELMATLPGAPIPEPAQVAAAALARQWKTLNGEVSALEKRIVRAAKENEAARRLMDIPGIGPIGASAIVAAVPDPHVFRSARNFAAWLGLTPRQNSSGDKHRSGAISKQGNRSLRQLLVLGATSYVKSAAPRGKQGQELAPAAIKDPWIASLLARRPRKVVAVAQAAKAARTAWALLAKGERYRAPASVLA